MPKILGTNRKRTSNEEIDKIESTLAKAMKSLPSSNQKEEDTSNSQPDATSTPNEENQASDIKIDDPSPSW